MTDPAKYPLSCRVIDLTDGCGSVMYGRTSGKRALYTCGRYLKLGGTACSNNQVDAEALLRFTLSSMTEMVDRLGKGDTLREKLLQRARHAASVPDDGADKARTELQSLIRSLEQKKNTAAENFSLTDDAELRAETERRYKQFKQELEKAKSELERMAPRTLEPQTAEAEVEKALSLLDNVHRVAGDPGARAEVPQLLKILNLRLGLKFVEAVKGRKRRVRQLSGGIIALGGTPLPHVVGNAHDSERAAVHDVPNKDSDLEEEYRLIEGSPTSATSRPPRNALERAFRPPR